MADTYAATVECIKRLAAESFTTHELTQEGPQEWRCGRKGTSAYSFRILFRPGMIAVWGDLGEWILRHSDRESLAWLRGAVRSPDYMLEKVQAGEKERFYPADALAWLASSEAVEMYGTDLVSAARKALDFDDGFSLTAETWATACFEAGMDDPPRFMYPCERALWLVELLRKFVSLEAALPLTFNAASPLDLAVVEEIEAAKSPEDRIPRPEGVPTVRRHRCLDSTGGLGTKAIYYLTLEFQEVPRG